MSKILLAVLLFLVGCTSPKFQKGDCISHKDSTIESHGWDDRIVRVDEDDFYILQSCISYNARVEGIKPCDYWFLFFKNQDNWEKVQCNGYERY